MAYNKYGVSPKEERTWNGKIYDSKLEKNYRVHLEMLKKAVDPRERVVDIQEQVAYQCDVNGVKICT